MDKILGATRLDTETHEALQQIARQQDRKIGYLVRIAVEQFVELAEKRRRSVRQSRSMAISREEGG
jgi:predicted transcriptional regulator